MVNFRRYSMEKYVILADVACDLSQEVRDFFQIDTYLPGHIHFSDGRDFATTLDWSNIDRESFYAALKNKKLEVSTAPPSPEEYYLTFKKYAEMGYQILSMSISSKISSTYNAAASAAKRLQEELPQVTIRCVDTLRMSGAFGLLVMYAHKLKNEGAGFDEVVAWVEENKHRVHQMGPIDDLLFVARRGRITMGKAIMGSFAGVKPMGDCNGDGYVSVLSNTKGIGRALDVTARYVKAIGTDLSEQYLLICHSNRQAYAEKLKELLMQTCAPKGVFVSDVFCGSGTNVGPGMVGVYFLGDAISEDLTVEKEALNSLL